MKCFRICMIAAAMIVAANTAKAQITVVENPVQANSFAEVSIKVPEKQSVVWDVSPDPVKIVENGETLYFNGPAGRYRVTATLQWIEGDRVRSKRIRQDVVIGRSPQPPPGPGPVDPVNPTDAFSLAIQAAYERETATDKATSVSKLASIYRVAATTTVLDPNITTNGQLFDTMQTASRTMLPATAIPLVRRVVGDRLNPLAGAVSTPIDRTKLAAEFKTIADALSAAK